LKQSKDTKLLDNDCARVDSLTKVKGEAVFGIDFRMPGMKVRSPVALSDDRRKVAELRR